MKLLKLLLPFSFCIALTACGNGAPSKSDVEDIFDSNSTNFIIKVTDLRCHPAKDDGFSCFLAYKKYWTEKGIHEGLKIAKELNFEQGEEKMKSLKSGDFEDQYEKENARFYKVDGNWKTNAFSKDDL